MNNNPFLKPWKHLYNSTYKSPTDPLFQVPPKVIYKYVTILRATEILSERNLYFSCPKNFNDPLDMYGGLMNFKPSRKRAIEFANQNNPHLPRKDRRQIASALQRKKGFIDFQENQFDNYKTSSGVCCFSECPDITLMWSHYADSHKGLVIGFNIDPVVVGLGIAPQEESFFFIQPVRYADEVQSLNYYDHKDKALSHLILTKSAVWSYEREVRAFMSGKNGKISFSPACVKEIYYGCRTGQKDREQLNELITSQFSEVASYEMVINPKKFKVESQLIPATQPKKKPTI